MSVLEVLRLGSSMSLRAVSRLGSSIAVLGFAFVGSSLSLRGLARLGASQAVCGPAQFGASLSLQGFARIGEYLSVQDRITTNDVIAEGTLSYGTASGGFIGASEATIDSLYAASAEVGGSIIASGGAAIGNTLGTQVYLDGLDGAHRIAYDQSGISFVAGGQERIQFDSTDGRFSGDWEVESPLTITQPETSGNTSLLLEAGTDVAEIRLAGGVLSMLAPAGRKVLSASPTTSTLHGTWVAEDVIAVSDRRLKRNIKSLRRSVDVGGQKASANASPAWLLRQLRPVSYAFRHREVDKSLRANARQDSLKDSATRYGFIADEVQDVLPSLVRNVHRGDRDALKAVAYQDMIALLVAAQQAQDEENVNVGARIESLGSSQEALGKRLSRVEHFVEESRLRHEKLTAQLGRIEQVVAQLVPNFGQENGPR